MMRPAKRTPPKAARTYQPPKSKPTLVAAAPPPLPVAPDTPAECRALARECLDTARMQRQLPHRDLEAARLLVRCAVSIWPDSAFL